MVNYSKIELFESINILNKLAKNGIPSFPEEICRFLTTEFSFQKVFIAEEISENEFDIISNSDTRENESLSGTFSLTKYEEIIKSCKYESNLIAECSTSLASTKPKLHNIVIAINDAPKYLLMLEHRDFPSNSDTENYFEISKFVQNLLFIWSKSPQIKESILDTNSSDFIKKSAKGLVKEIKTVDGLLTLIKEEQIPNAAIKYIEGIKSANQYIINSINDLSNLVTIGKSDFVFSETLLDIGILLKEFSDSYMNEENNIDLKINNSVSDKILFDKNHLEYILFNSTNFVSAGSRSKKIKIESQMQSNEKLRISVSTDSLNLGIEKLNNLAEPFENKSLSSKQSGLTLTLLKKYTELLNGNIKFDESETDFSVNIILPLKKSLPTFSIETLVNNTDAKKDKILVIESDNASSSLLNNYLSKWNYKTEIVSSGTQALNLIKKNKYVAVILNVEQENENSLELLQKIKNNKSTRNVPVIVFSVEVEKEKIYLMGSVEYLVKPINYNNLVEILTSYKLRRNSTVLCVDDDQPTLNLVKQAIQTAGFNVVSEHRPELVKELISDKDLDLAIVDLDMPKMNGFELIKEIKSNDKFSKLPIIIYTGKEDYQEDLQNIDGMFVDLLDKKSTSFNELENTILDMIKSYEEPDPIKDSDDEFSGPKILMAEDYKHSQIIVTRLLKKSGFESIIVVENGEEALNICENDKIDLVLMDMQMPVMNGFEATGKIRELEGYADTPIIALTAFAMKGDREKCLEAGATDYIPKPIDSKEFIEKVKYYTQLIEEAK